MFSGTVQVVEDEITWCNHYKMETSLAVVLREACPTDET